jgi:hypothetical protein
MTLNAASEGFRNQGQFLAALHVSKNLNIPFKDLKAAMLGTPPTPAPTLPGSVAPGSTPTGSTTTPTGSTTTGSTTTSTPMSLGQAIHKLRPSVDSTTAAQTATTQASTDLGATTTATSTSTSTTTTAKKKHR